MQDNRITNVRILYNQHNIDSTLAAAYLCTVIRKADDHFFGNTGKDIGALTITTQHYDYVRHTPTKGKVDVLYVLGVTLLGSDLLSEIDACQPDEIMEFHYKPSAVRFSDTQASYKYREITPINMVDGEVLLNEEAAESSVAVLVAAYLEPLWSKCSDIKTDELKRLIKSAGHYINFKRFDRFFKFDDVKPADTGNAVPNKDGDRTADDLAYLHRHFNRIKYSAANACVLELTDDYEFDSKHYMARVGVARNIINRNMTQANYSTTTKYAVIPTVCVGEESALEVMRQLSYPYKTVITYEDVRNQRVWRIYSANPVGIMDMLRAVIKPTEEWSECQVQYMTTEVPLINKI